MGPFDENVARIPYRFVTEPLLDGNSVFTLSAYNSARMNKLVPSLFLHRLGWRKHSRPATLTGSTSITPTG
jgi:hypothetical protein